MRNAPVALPRMHARPHPVHTFARDIPRLPGAYFAAAPRLPNERAEEPVEGEDRLADAALRVQNGHRTFGNDLLDAPARLALVFEFVYRCDNHASSVSSISRRKFRTSFMSSLNRSSSASILSNNSICAGVSFP